MLSNIKEIARKIDITSGLCDKSKRIGNAWTEPLAVGFSVDNTNENIHMKELVEISGEAVVETTSVLILGKNC